MNELNKCNVHEYTKREDDKLIKLNKDDKLTDEEEVQEYRAMVGTAMWVRITRPEIAYELACLARGIMKPTINDVERLNKLVKYLKKTCADKRIITTMEGKLSMVTFTDASFATLHDLKSRPGLVEVMSRRSLGMEPAKHNPRQISAALLTDSDGVCTAVAGTKQVDCKRRRIDIDHLRECTELNDLASVQHIPREYNVADAVTATRSPGTASNTRLRDMLYRAMWDLPKRLIPGEELPERVEC